MARGRPRKFDEDTVLSAATLLFWEKGLSATSLDDLALAMDMSRPSIYNAFGSKDAIYRATLARFCAQFDDAMSQIVAVAPTLRSGLTAFFEQAIDLYCSNTPAMGCLMICTAPSEALTHPEIGEDLQNLIAHLDDCFARQLRQAQISGELSTDIAPENAAKLLQATLHTLALRARAGESPQELKKLASLAVSTLLKGSRAE